MPSPTFYLRISSSFTMIWCAVVFLLAVFTGEANAKYNRVCYYTNWSQYRPGDGKFKPKDIEPDLCTHLIYAFGELKNNQLKTYEWNDEDLYKEFNIDIKQKNPNVKTLLAIGGWNAASAEFTKLVSSPVNRSSFAIQSIEFLRKYGFDGLDLDWEYPANRGGVKSDKVNFGLLCKELRAAYEEEAVQTGNDRLLLTAAVAAGKTYVDSGYDVPVIAQSLDFISLMSYDLHGAWESVTGHNSPLFSSSSESGERAQLNIKWAAEYWVSKGTPKTKLNIGLATYGRTFTLSDRTNYGMGAPASGAGTAGAYTRANGFLSYYEICQQQASGQGNTYRETKQEVPYYVNGNQWAGFDDETSIATKVSWIVDQGYAGGMVWALPLDDFNSICPSTKERFPLIRRMANDLIAAEGGQPVTTAKTTSATVIPPISSTGQASSSQSSSASTPAQTTTKTSTTTSRSTTIDSGSGFSCSGKADGNYPDRSNCSKYIVCSHGKLYEKNCAPGLLWNPERGYCDWPRNVQCNVVSTAQPTDKTNVPTTTQSSSATDKITTTLKTTTTSTTNVPTTTQPSSATDKSTTLKTTTTSTQTTTTATSDFSCEGKSAGNYPHPSDCSKFIMCTAAEIMYVKDCPPNQYWNPNMGYCDWMSNVQCNAPPTTDQSAFSCQGKTDGIYPNDADCRKYFVCSFGKSFPRDCGPRLLWNKNGGFCDWPGNVIC